MNLGFDKNVLQEYLRYGMVSEPLAKRVISYANQLWNKERGYQVPVFVKESPSYIQESIMAAAYGHHLYEVAAYFINLNTITDLFLLKNFVFVSCHNDFLRLLIAKLQVKNFFAGDMICQQGDVDNQMYFIHKGKVEVFHVDQNVEIVVDELQERDSFGVVSILLMCGCFVDVSVVKCLNILNKQGYRNRTSVLCDFRVTYFLYHWEISMTSKSVNSDCRWSLCDVNVKIGYITYIRI